MVIWRTIAVLAVAGYFIFRSGPRPRLPKDPGIPVRVVASTTVSATRAPARDSGLTRP
jgi:hypothetical protein